MIFEEPKCHESPSGKRTPLGKNLFILLCLSFSFVNLGYNCLPSLVGKCRQNSLGKNCLWQYLLTMPTSETWCRLWPPSIYCIYKIKEKLWGGKEEGGKLFRIYERSQIQLITKSFPLGWQTPTVDILSGCSLFLSFTLIPPHFSCFISSQFRILMFFANLFLMGLLASRKPCQIIIIQLLFRDPCGCFHLLCIPPSFSPPLAGEVFFSLRKCQIKNPDLWPSPVCSSKGVPALSGWWSFYVITSSLAIHIYTLANKKAFVKLFLSNKLKTVRFRRIINLLLFLSQVEERCFFKRGF